MPDVPTYDRVAALAGCAAIDLEQIRERLCTVVRTVQVGTPVDITAGGAA